MSNKAYWRDRYIFQMQIVLLLNQFTLETNTDLKNFIYCKGTFELCLPKVEFSPKINQDRDTSKFIDHNKIIFTVKIG